VGCHDTAAGLVELVLEDRDDRVRREDAGHARRADADVDRLVGDHRGHHGKAAGGEQRALVPDHGLDLARQHHQHLLGAVAVAREAHPRRQLEVDGGHARGAGVAVDGPRGGDGVVRVAGLREGHQLKVLRLHGLHAIS
jgi:hypothetical protein